MALAVFVASAALAAASFFLFRWERIHREEPLPGGRFGLCGTIDQRKRAIRQLAILLSTARLCALAAVVSFFGALALLLFG